MHLVLLFAPNLQFSVFCLVKRFDATYRMMIITISNCFGCVALMIVESGRRPIGNKADQSAIGPRSVADQSQKTVTIVNFDRGEVAQRLSRLTDLKLT